MTMTDCDENDYKEICDDDDDDDDEDDGYTHQ